MATLIGAQVGYTLPVVTEGTLAPFSGDVSVLGESPKGAAAPTILGLLRRLPGSLAAQPTLGS